MMRMSIVVLQKYQYIRIFQYQKTKNASINVSEPHQGDLQPCEHTQGKALLPLRRPCEAGPEAKGTFEGLQCNRHPLYREFWFDFSATFRCNTCSLKTKEPNMSKWNKHISSLTHCCIHWERKLRANTCATQKKVEILFMFSSFLHRQIKMCHLKKWTLWSPHQKWRPDFHKEVFQLKTLLSTQRFNTHTLTERHMRTLKSPFFLWTSIRHCNLWTKGTRVSLECVWGQKKRKKKKNMMSGLVRTPGPRRF